MGASRGGRHDALALLLAVALHLVARALQLLHLALPGHHALARLQELGVVLLGLDVPVLRAARRVGGGGERASVRGAARAGASAAARVRA